MGRFITQGVGFIESVTPWADVKNYSKSHLHGLHDAPKHNRALKGLEMGFNIPSPIVHGGVEKNRPNITRTK